MAVTGKEAVTLEQLKSLSGLGGGGISEIPIATEDTLGGVKVGENVSVDETGVLTAQTATLEEFKEYMGGSVNEDGSISSYELPIASSTTLGGVKIGEGISVTADGIISAGAVDLSNNVDNETIIYGQKDGAGDKKLYVPEEKLLGSNANIAAYIKDGSIEISKLSDDLQAFVFSMTNKLDSLAWSEIDAMTSNPAFTDVYLVNYIEQTKQVSISGYGTFDMVCVGVRHFDLSDGSGKAGFAFMPKEKVVTTHRMNASNTTSGGWASSEMRTWMNGTLLPAYPSDLSQYIKQVKVKYNTESGAESTSNDRLFALSEEEIFGTTNYDSSGDQLEYWDSRKTNNDRVMFNGSSETWWWLRSVTMSGYFACVDLEGSLYNGYNGEANRSYGVVPCFNI